MHATPSVSQRPAVGEDEDFLFRLYAGTRAGEMAAWGWPPAQQESFLRMQFRARQATYSATYPGASHAILLLDGAPIGAAIVCQSADGIRLVDIAFLPEHRGRGCGGQWLRGLIAAAGAARLPLRLSVFRGNPAIRLYERLGFVSTETGAMYIEMEHQPRGIE